MKEEFKVNIKVSDDPEKEGVVKNLGIAQRLAKEIEKENLLDFESIEVYRDSLVLETETDSMDRDTILSLDYILDNDRVQIYDKEWEISYYDNMKGFAIVINLPQEEE